MSNGMSLTAPESPSLKAMRGLKPTALKLLKRNTLGGILEDTLLLTKPNDLLLIARCLVGMLGVNQANSVKPRTVR